MKHYILVKWNNQLADKKKCIPEIRQIFEKTLGIPGINAINIKENIVNRENRFDLMICLSMDENSLKLYDESEPHFEWKNKFGKYIEKKAIFDASED